MGNAEVLSSSPHHSFGADSLILILSIIDSQREAEEQEQ